MRRSHFKLWIPCILFYMFITFVSSIPGSSLAGIIIVPFVYFDKMIHFVLYGFFGIVMARALAWEEYYHHLKKRWYIYFAVILPLVSLADELHQFFVPDRSMDYYDWFADIVGAACGAAFYMFFVLRKEDEKSLDLLEKRDVRGFGLVLAMTYFMTLLGLNILNYKQGFLKDYSHLIFIFILIEYGLLGLLTIRFIYLRRDRRAFLLRDWLFVTLFGAVFICLYQLSLYVLRDEFLEVGEVFWSLLSLLLGATGYYLDVRIERFRRQIHADPFYKRKTWQRVYFFLPPLLIICAISSLSSQSPKILYGTSIPSPNQILPQEGVLSIFTNYFVLHSIQFFTLGLFYFRAIKWEGWWHFRRRRMAIWIFSTLLIFAYAVGDEVHQYYTPGRVGDPYDVLTNFLGLVVALSLYLFIYRKVRDKYFSEEQAAQSDPQKNLLHQDSVVVTG